MSNQSKQLVDADSGRRVEITTHSDERRMFFDLPANVPWPTYGGAHDFSDRSEYRAEGDCAVYLRNGRLEDPEGRPVKLDRPMYVNLPPAPSAVDSLWKAIWLFLKESW